MDQEAHYPQIVKSMIADAGRSHQPTLLYICQVDANGKCEVHEQLSDGGCSVWPEIYSGRHQAESAIYQLQWSHFLNRPARSYESANRPSLSNDYAELVRSRYWGSGDTIPTGMLPLPLSSASPLRIIVADDQEWIRTILIHVVQQTFPTATVMETEHGVQAFEAFRSGDCHFLVSNHSMPRLDGPSLIRQVRLEAPDLPIAMVSTKSEARSDALAAGANWFLAKEQIMEHLPRLLRRYAATGTKPEAMAAS